MIAIEPLGDSALILRLAEQDDNPEPTVRAILDLRQRLQTAGISGVVEITTAFTTVTLFYDPAVVAADGHTSIFSALETQIRGVIDRQSDDEPAITTTESPAIEIGVCYEPEFALDLEEVARHTGLRVAEIVRRHASSEYRVRCVGFTPGFPYLSGLVPELAVPRRTTPRTVVPAGSVAIGGPQAGIYPLQSPGGWQVIGRTPVVLFDATRQTPGLLRAGDRVRFREITTEQFYAAAAEVSCKAVQAPANK